MVGRLRAPVRYLAGVRFGPPPPSALPGSGRPAPLLPPRTHADVERAIRLHTRTGRLVRPAQTGAAELSCRTGEDESRGFHEVVEDRGQVLMAVGGRHQCDEPAHRVEADLAEMPVPVDRGQRGDGFGIGAQDVDGGAKRSGTHRDRLVHGGAPRLQHQVSRHAVRRWVGSESVLVAGPATQYTPPCRGAGSRAPLRCSGSTQSNRCRFRPKPDNRLGFEPITDLHGWIRLPLPVPGQVKRVNSSQAYDVSLSMCFSLMCFWVCGTSSSSARCMAPSSAESEEPCPSSS